MIYYKLSQPIVIIVDYVVLCVAQIVNVDYVVHCIAQIINVDDVVLYVDYSRTTYI